MNWISPADPDVLATWLKRRRRSGQEISKKAEKEDEEARSKNILIRVLLSLSFSLSVP
ncbi:hypothetical protein [Candidatus Nitrososphaera evergladensis]|jgi:hypothetical protein|uniref:hypothetical protein n=1 Tax=Candidatus Nitrososphaera evergladensis TaxID=1459637 RepID=UPI00130D801D|nr:hypothetical protein [Candidatus Nitrososphaera evergladensis]